MEIPSGLIDDFMNGDVVIFSGAGISTENPTTLKTTFYEDICLEIGDESFEKPFPEVMEEFVEGHNGRINLLTKIKGRFDHIDSFNDLKWNSTRFHKELATFYPVDTIVTTNWDRYFEEVCGATAFTHAEDLAFWTAPGRKVLKIHGSIDNYGSIVATTTDYDRCEKELNTGMIGSTLKLLLATKTIVYCGYSLRDDDFQRINTFVQGEMKGLHRQAYMVSPFEPAVDLAEHGVKPIFTDATYFIKKIKEHAEVRLAGHYLPDSIYELAERMLEKSRDAHAELHANYGCRRNPEIILCGSYQDGLIHAFERIIELRKTGHYSHKCNVGRTLETYEDLKEEYINQGIFETAAYIEGYTNAQILIMMSDEEDGTEYFPLFYVFNSKHELVTFKDYKKISKKIKSLNRAAYYRAKASVEEHIEHAGNVVFRHRACL